MTGFFVKKMTQAPLVSRRSQEQEQEQSKASIFGIFFENPQKT
jgi:hypothetical protein